MSNNYENFLNKKKEQFLSVKYSPDFMNTLSKYIEKKQKQAGESKKILRRDVVHHALKTMIDNDTYEV